MCIWLPYYCSPTGSKNCKTVLLKRQSAAGRQCILLHSCQESGRRAIQMLDSTTQAHRNGAVQQSQIVALSIYTILKSTRPYTAYPDTTVLTLSFPLCPLVASSRHTNADRSQSCLFTHFLSAISVLNLTSKTCWTVNGKWMESD